MKFISSTLFQNLVAVLWYNIGTIFFESGEAEDVAIQYYKETLRIERKSLGDDHPDVVLTLLHVGQRHQKMGNLEEALKYFFEAITIEQKRNGKDHVAVGKILNLIGNIHLQQGNVKEMMKCYTDAARIFESHRQPGVTLVIAGYNAYGLSKLHPECAAMA